MAQAIEELHHYLISRDPVFVPVNFENFLIKGHSIRTSLGGHRGHYGDEKGGGKRKYRVASRKREIG